MEFRQIEAFINVVKYKSFSRAADASFLTQPTISAHLSNLEKEMGAQLINRTGREITLTKQGEALYPFAVEMLHTRARALRCMQQNREDMEGVLDIYTSSIPGQYYLPRLLRQFREKYNNIRFYVEQSDSRQVIESILSHKGEIGLTGLKINNGLDYEPLFQDEMVLLTPDKKPFAQLENGSQVDMEAFQNENFILREDGSGTRQEMERLEVEGVSLLKKVNVIARMNSMEAIKQAVADGLGVSILSRIAVESGTAHYPVKYFRIAGVKRKRVFYLVSNKMTLLSPAAEAFRSMALSFVESNPPMH